MATLGARSVTAGLSGAEMCRISPACRRFCEFSKKLPNVPCAGVFRKGVPNRCNPFNIERSWEQSNELIDHGLEEFLPAAGAGGGFALPEGVALEFGKISFTFFNFGADAAVP